MKHKYKRAMALLLALCAALGLAVGMAPTASAATPATVSNVSYLDANGVERTQASAISANSAISVGCHEWESGWYVLDRGIKAYKAIVVTGDVHLILADGITMTAIQGGFTVNSGNSLTIYGQSQGTGTLNATGWRYQAGIGGDEKQSGGTITINGGIVTAQGGEEGTGIGGGYVGGSGTIIINGGTVTATGGMYGAGIGSGFNHAMEGEVIINGGTVTATGGLNSAGIGGGSGGAGGTITINGGTVTATGGSLEDAGAAGIGGGARGVGGTITINGGSVTANGGNNGAGIGGGSNRAGATITINGGTVTATGGSYNDTFGSGIGDGYRPSNSNATVLTVDDNLSVKSGNDAASATTVTDFAVNHTQKYAYIFSASASSTPSYAVTTADTDTTAGKKYKFGDTFTIAVTVSGADFEGGEFTLTYDKDTLEATEVMARTKNGATANVTSASLQTAGKVQFSAKTTEAITNGSTLAEITFRVKASVSEETVCEFSFESAPKICYDVQRDSIEAATLMNGSVTVEPVPYAVTLTGNNGVTFLDSDSQVITTDTAIAGQAYSVTIGTYSAADYEYDVTLTIGGASATAPTPDANGVLTIPAASVTGAIFLTVTRTAKPITATLVATPSGAFTLSGDTAATKGADYTATIGDYDANNYAYEISLTVGGASVAAPAPDANGVITIAGANVTGNFTLTVTRTLANFAVQVFDDYVTGWTLVTVAKTAANHDSPVYNYNGNAMLYVNAYGAYAYLISGVVTEADAKTKVTLGTASAGTIAAGYDVNNTGKVDYSDALLTYRCYVKAYQTPATAMESYLRADVDGSHKVDTTDVSEIDASRRPET